MVLWNQNWQHLKNIRFCLSFSEDLNITSFANYKHIEFWYTLYICQMIICSTKSTMAATITSPPGQTTHSGPRFIPSADTTTSTSTMATKETKAGIGSNARPNTERVQGYPVHSHYLQPPSGVQKIPDQLTELGMTQQTSTGSRRSCPRDDEAYVTG